MIVVPGESLEVHGQVRAPLTLHRVPAAGNSRVMWGGPGCSVLAFSPSSLPHFPNIAGLAWPELFSILVLSQNHEDENWHALTSPSLVTEKRMH